MTMYIDIVEFQLRVYRGVGQTTRWIASEVQQVLEKSCLGQKLKLIVADLRGEVIPDISLAEFV
jgi:hypothetical protein